MATKTLNEKIQAINEIISYACMGCDGYIRHFTGLVYTNHIQEIADIAGGFWLIDAIASYQRKEEFQVWELEVNTEKHSAVLTMKEDTDQPELVRQEIEYTDFPMSLKLYVELGSVDCVHHDYILLLPESR